MKELYYGGRRHKALYHGGTLVWERPEPVDPRMAAWWRFNGAGAQDTVADKTGNGNNLTLRGFAHTSGSGWTADGLRLDGVDDYCECPHSESMALQSFTALLWITYLDSPKKQSLLSKSGLNEDYMLYYDARGASNHRIGMTLSGTDINVAYELQDGQRYLLGYTYDGSTGRIYIDGEQVTTLTHTAPLVNSTRKVLVGAYENMGSATMSTCIFHEIRLYGEALTAEEIRSIHTGGVQLTTQAGDLLVTQGGDAIQIEEG